jgi:putative transposase
MALNERTFTCPDSECGHVGDRDVNAAKNIPAAGLAVAACGDGVRHDPSQGECDCR